MLCKILGCSSNFQSMLELVGLKTKSDAVNKLVRNHRLPNI